MTHFENVKSVTFDHHRWYMRIEIENQDGSTNVFFASADSSIASSGLWFGTEEEYDEASDW